jgi:hypothetical protein
MFFQWISLHGQIVIVYTLCDPYPSQPDMEVAPKSPNNVFITHMYIHPARATNYSIRRPKPSHNLCPPTALFLTLKPRGLASVGGI